MHFPFRLLTGLTQRGEKPLPILAVLKYVLSAITTIHHVVHRPRILNAQFAWHGSRLSPPPTSIVRTDTCPCPRLRLQWEARRLWGEARLGSFGCADHIEHAIGLDLRIQAKPQRSRLEVGGRQAWKWRVRPGV